MMAVGGHGVEIGRGLAFGGDNGSPPLVTHCGNVYKIKQLEGHISLDQRVRLTLVEHPATQIGEPLLLECRCGNGGIELFVSHAAPPSVSRQR